MHLNTPLNEVLGQASKVKILRFMVKSQAQLNGREIAKNIGLSHVKVHSALKNLSRQGIVNMHFVGNSIVYWLNEEHYLVKEILRPAFEKESGIFQSIIKIILEESRPPLPLSIILFGSFAKNNALADSDIDLLLIYPGHKNRSFIPGELSGAEKKITMLLGNHLAGIPIKISEFQNRLKKNERFLKEAITTGRVIYGKTVSELINHVSKKY